MKISGPFSKRKTWPPREIKVILEQSNGKTDVVAGGIATKNREDFQTEFEKMTESLRRSK